MVLGEAGSGWACVVNELALERSGPDRFLSEFLLLQEIVRRVGDAGAQEERGITEIGRLLAHLLALRSMSFSVAGMLDEGRAPETEAALVKDLGNTTEQEVAETGRRLFPLGPGAEAGGDLEAMLAQAVLEAPSFSLRGGTREVLRGIIARGLGLR